MVCIFTTQYYMNINWRQTKLKLYLESTERNIWKKKNQHRSSIPITYLYLRQASLSHINWMWRLTVLTFMCGAHLHALPQAWIFTQLNYIRITLMEINLRYVNGNTLHLWYWNMFFIWKIWRPTISDSVIIQVAYFIFLMLY